MSETHGEPEETTETEVQPETTGEDEVQSKEAEAVSSPPDEEKPTSSKPQDEEGKSQVNKDEKPTASERQDEEDKSQVNEKPEATPKEEEPTAKPVTGQQQTLRCFDPTGTVDIRTGSSGVAADEPMTVAQFFKRTFDRIPDSRALCWKDNKEGPWQTLTYTQYKALIYNVAKSFLKVMYY